MSQNQSSEPPVVDEILDSIRGPGAQELWLRAWFSNDPVFVYVTSCCLPLFEAAICDVADALGFDNEDVYR